jgi:hypothetical protein
MTQFVARTAGAAAALALFTFAAGTASAQQLDKNLVGAWTIVSIKAGEGDKATEPYGPNPRGSQVYNADGRFAIVVTRGDLPKVASNNRATATADESEKIVHGSIGYFGSYTTNAADNSVTVQIEGATFANWIGTSQKRTYTISGDELILKNPTGSGGAAVTVVMKRAGAKAM